MRAVHVMLLLLLSPAGVSLAQTESGDHAPQAGPAVSNENGSASSTGTASGHATQSGASSSAPPVSTKGVGIGPGMLPADVMPKLISHVDPRYSEDARKVKKSGVVLVGLVIDEHGLPRDVHVIRGVGYGLDESAVEAVSQYRFRPAMKNGVPVAVKINVQVNFQIFDKPQDVPGGQPGLSRP